MYVHTFNFRWKPEVTQEQIAKVMPAIRAFQGKIPGLHEVWVGFNQSPKSPAIKFGGVMRFADKPSYDAYTHHPMHLALLEWLVPMIDASEVDFEA